MEDQNAIRVENLSKLYHLGSKREKYRTLRDTMTGMLRRTGPGRRSRNTNTLWALRNVNFEVKHGEALGVIGRNGAGKSTLLKILSRITDPTEGEVVIRGRVGSLLEVGTGFHPELSGRENIYLNGAILGMRRSEVERKFDEMIAFAEVERFIDTPVKHYSSGMYLRLAFAVAAHLEPEVLVVDEVLAVGDASFQKKCLGKMDEVAREGRTVLFVSHNMPAITRLCTRAIMLDKGQIVADGPSIDVVGAYLRGSEEGGARQEWDLDKAPGTDEVKLTSVNLTVGGQAQAVVGVGDDLEVNVGYHVAAPDTRLRCALAFYTQGVCAFASVEPTEVTREDPGTYYSTVKIPRNLLAEGEYSVRVSLFSSRGVKAHFVKQQEALAFQVIDPMTGDSARGDYAEGIGGVLRPLLDWQLSYSGK